MTYTLTVGALGLQELARWHHDLDPRRLCYQPSHALRELALHLSCGRAPVKVLFEF